MKKLFSILVILTLIIGLGACSPSQDNYEKRLNELEEKLEVLETDLEFTDEQLEAMIVALETRLDNLLVVYGLNGQVSIYEKEKQMLYETNKKAYVGYLSATIIDITGEADFDTQNLAPGYIKDVDGNYISISQLGGKLRTKYYNFDTSQEATEKFSMGNESYFRYSLVTNIDIEDVVARTIILFEELRNYDFYIIGSTELVIHLYVFKDGVDTQVTFNVPMQIVLNNFFEFNADNILNNDYEVSLSSGVINKELVKQYYDNYKLNGTYDGYVLNYSK